ncbi:transcription factor bHLH128-like isoform X1 [Ananas comosus]|uniref:Transcription factor bHLH128-like isoform X1 n=1 Tax=Ananas comosus TaxID=4615 RepID=A0A6P5EZU5_ANACO|nr:transcription factor bHLH128-like isoform X1 [Ananas comosus]
MMNRFEPDGRKKPSPMGPPAGLARFGSAPGSLLAGIADSVIGGAGGGGRAALVRHSSSPAGLLSHLGVDHAGPRGIGSYSQTGTEFVQAMMASQKLRPQWSFSRQDSLSQIAEMSIPDIGESSNDFSITSWDDTNSFMFSAPSSKRAKDNNAEIITSMSNLDSQIGLQGTSLEISGMENYLQIQEDSVACKLRAKRGCATHPRSIAERERRIRISKRLRKLQDLVPNMDKQTSTSDMLDLAVQYIKDLQSQVQKLNEEQANCTCSSKV